MHVCEYLCMCVCVYLCMHVGKCVYVYVWVWVHMCVCVCVRVCSLHHSGKRMLRPNRFRKEQDVYRNVLRLISPQIKVKQLILSYRSVLPKAVFIKKGGTHPKCTIYAFTQRANTKQASGSEKKVSLYPAYTNTVMHSKSMAMDAIHFH